MNMMDQELVLKAVKRLFDEREKIVDEIEPSHMWDIVICISDECAFSVDLDEMYLLKMLSEHGQEDLEQIITDYICSEIDISLDGGETYIEKKRTLH